MSHKEKDQQHDLPTPWRQIHIVIWLIGLAILAWRDWWFPGILVLVAISVAFQGYVRARYPKQQPVAPSAAAATITPPTQTAAPPAHQASLPFASTRYPARCPSCGAPVKAQTTQETGACAYCGAHIAPLN